MEYIPGYEGRYAATETGDIWSLPTAPNLRRRKLKPYPTRDGYMKVQLYTGGKSKSLFVHRLVAETFIPNPASCKVVNHIDADPGNNAVSNLEWVDQSKNIKWSHKLGRQAKDRRVTVVDKASGETYRFATMQSASTAVFGSPFVIRSHFRRKGCYFEYKGKRVCVE